LGNKGGLIFLGLLFGAAIILPLVFRRRETAAYQLVPVRRTRQLLPQPQTTYTNTEEWELEYNEDGLVKRVVVHRRAVQE